MVVLGNERALSRSADLIAVPGNPARDHNMGVALVMLSAVSFGAMAIFGKIA